MFSPGAASQAIPSNPSLYLPSRSIKWAPLRRPLQFQQRHLICLCAARFCTTCTTSRDPDDALTEKPDFPNDVQRASAIPQSAYTFSAQRRALLQSIFLNFAAASMATVAPAIATEEASKCGADFAISDKMYFDISIDREPVGRIVVGLYNEDVPLGAKRFAEIAVGSKGVSYRKKEFDKITPSYIQNAGVRNFSLSGGARDAAGFTGGETAEALMPELEDTNRRCPNRTKNIAGAVSIIVKDLTKPPPKPKLVAKDGKFEVIEEELRPDPNGTQFAIVLQDSPQLDASNLVVGKVIDGFDVLKLISGVRVVKDNTGSPYFKAAKLVGDTRAVVAERGFYRPYSKIAIARSGRLES